MKIFLDTEFTDFPESECDMISIGLVDETGREFYAELTDYRQETCNQFVREVVLPLLKKHPTRIEGKKFDVAKALAAWLEQYRGEDCFICFDYHTDWNLMGNMLNLLPDEDIPSFVKPLNIRGELNIMKLEYFWQDVDELGWKQHHALYDAHGNWRAYQPFDPNVDNVQDIEQK
jgi:hypothetical protein